MLSLILLGKWMNRGNTDMTVEMPHSTMPVMCLMCGDKEYNEMMPYSEDMDILRMNDHITPLGSDRTLDFKIDMYGNDILKLSFQLRSLQDERLIEEIVDEEISIGDFVVSGGEIGAVALADAVARLCDGVLADDECYTEDSYYNGLLEYPQYSRPAVWHGKEVPEILTSGHHANIAKWRRERSLEITLARRPDLLENAELTKEDREYLEKIKASGEK